MIDTTYILFVCLHIVHGVEHPEDFTNSYIVVVTCLWK